MAVQCVVRQGRREDMPGLLKLVVDEGWNDVQEDLQILFDLFTEGVIVAESLDGEIISTCVSVPLDDSNGQIALYVTKKSCRGQGIGKQVFDLSFKALGDRNIALNSAWDKVEMYAAQYFTIAPLTLLIYEFPVRNFLQTRRGESSSKIVEEDEADTHSSTSFKIVDIKEVDVNQIIGYDKKIHPMPRQKLLKWVLGFALAGRVALDGDEIIGWGTVHKSNRGYRMMPLYSDTPEVGEDLAVALLKQVAEDPETMIEIIFPEDNRTSEKLYSNLGVFSGECRHHKYKRMYTKMDIPVPSHFVYSILNDCNTLV